MRRRFWPTRRDAHQPLQPGSIVAQSQLTPMVVMDQARSHLLPSIRLLKHDATHEPMCSSSHGEKLCQNCAEECSAADDDHDECAICLEPMCKFLPPSSAFRPPTHNWNDTHTCTLPCKHIFHASCVEELRSSTAPEACPLCRESLPEPAADLFEAAMDRYNFIEKSMYKSTGKLCWADSASTQAHKRDLRFVLVSLLGAAQQGNQEAQHILGFFYSQGRGVPKDAATAVYWYSQSAHKGYVKAQLNLGVMFKLGRGVPQSDKEAYLWFNIAAVGGCHFAQYRVGTMKMNGQGTKQCNVNACQWFALAADQGNRDARSMLGVMLRYGRGIAENHDEAIRLFGLAAGQGDDIAQQNLNEMALEHTAASAAVKLSDDEPLSTTSASKSSLPQSPTPTQPPPSPPPPPNTPRNAPRRIRRSASH